MTRGAGFDIADTDTGMLADKKVLALARRLRDATKTGAAIALYDAVRLASWKDGSRLRLDDAVPGWWLDPIEELVAALVDAELLDEEHRIPVRAWAGWFEVARARRDRYRELGRKGGLVSHPPKPALEPTLKPTVNPTLEHTLDRTVKPVPSVPTEPYSARAPAREGDAVAEATDGETTTCVRCHGPATDGNPFQTMADGRVKHRFSPCPAATEATSQKDDWLAGGQT